MRRSCKRAQLRAAAKKATTATLRWRVTAHRRSTAHRLYRRRIARRRRNDRQRPPDRRGMLAHAAIQQVRDRLNCGCAGTTCDFVLDSGEPNLPTACTPSVGSAVAGASCAFSTDCAQGLTCLFDKCHEFCGNAGDPCAVPFSACHNHASTTGYNVCGIKCDLSSASSCGTLGCVGVSDGTGATSECEPVGTGTNGVACAGPLDCAPGFYCVSDATCRQTCNLASPVCATGSCNNFTTALIVDGVTYGYCN